VIGRWLIAILRRLCGGQPEDPCVGVRAPLKNGPKDRSAAATVERH
jgi:hypothetical protein